MQIETEYIMTNIPFLLGHQSHAHKDKKAYKDFESINLYYFHLSVSNHYTLPYIMTVMTVQSTSKRLHWSRKIRNYFSLDAMRALILTWKELLPAKYYLEEEYNFPAGRYAGQPYD
jgi:hypothetical protein